MSFQNTDVVCSPGKIVLRHVRENHHMAVQKSALKWLNTATRAMNFNAISAGDRACVQNMIGKL
jgi:hypothetical protein